MVEGGRQDNAGGGGSRRLGCEKRQTRPLQACMRAVRFVLRPRPASFPSPLLRPSSSHRRRHVTETDTGRQTETDRQTDRRHSQHQHQLYQESMPRGSRRQPRKRSTPRECIPPATMLTLRSMGLTHTQTRAQRGCGVTMSKMRAEGRGRERKRRSRCKAPRAGEQEWEMGRRGMSTR